MEIIEELEASRRGLYGGAVGCLSYTGNMEMAIAIRTILMKGKTAHFQAGAGIVADSVPETEFEEIQNKLATRMAALRMAEGVQFHPESILTEGGKIYFGISSK